ncbi:MAG: phytanoyl-CoA dioxygenase family protein [Flavobacteriales bacterium]|nr:phytanoyl-CoA dioxygenase family protein [Flavobacteriales bacterium]
MEKALFKDQKLQAQFEKDGFVKIQLLEQGSVDSLNRYYQDQKFDNKIEAGFHISLDNQNEDLVNEVSQKIKETLLPKSDLFFQDYQSFTASYVIKEPGKQNIVPPHQDWTFVDENEFCSATVWTPLLDVTENNGALAVIKGSHRLFKHFRSSPSPQSKSPLSDHIFTLFPYTTVIEMKAGEALVFDNRLIHASPPNLSDQARVAVGIGITSQEASLRHYYQNPKKENQLEAYEVSPSFFNYYNNKRLSDLFDKGELPSELKQITSVSREVPSLTKEAMEKLVQQLDGVEYNHDFMERLAKLFNYSASRDKLETQKDKPIMEEKKEEQNSTEYKDPRSFFQKYTPLNIIREILWRLKGRPNLEE